MTTTEIFSKSNRRMAKRDGGGGGLRQSHKTSFLKGCFWRGWGVGLHMHRFSQNCGVTLGEYEFRAFPGWHVRNSS